jgi:orotate phosphoribosyltransferase
MTIGTTKNQLTAHGDWSAISARLGAIVNFTARLGHRYRSLEFDCPSVLNLRQAVNQDTMKWHSSTGVEAWLKTRGRKITVGARFDASAAQGSLIFWAILDTLDTHNSFSGVMVGRPYANATVGKAIRTGSFEFSDRGLCLLATAELGCAADRDLLSLLAKGFSEAASDQDRDAWASWLWSQVSQGHLSPLYAKKLGVKILGRHAREHTAPRLFDDSTEISKSLEAIGVFERDADYVLPSGLHADVHVNLGTACGLPKVVEQLAQRVKQLVNDVDYDTIVSTGWPVAMIAREIIRHRPMTRLGVVRHCQCEGVPPLPLAPVLTGSRVVVLTDVVVTGHLLRLVTEMVRQAGASLVAVVTIVDGGYPKPIQGTVRFMAVCQYDVRAVPADLCPRCGRLEQREFNPVACCMTSKKTEPRSPGQFLKENDEAVRFWRQVDAARAYEHHRIDGKTHYVSFIDTERLLTHETVGPIVLKKVAAQIPKLIGRPDNLLVPGKSRARTFANMLLREMGTDGRLWPPKIIAAKRINERFLLSNKESQLLKHAQVLIVDTGVSSGSTLEELNKLAVSCGATRVAAAVIISRMSDTQESAISAQLGGRFWRLYQIPIRPLSIPDALRHLCPTCSRRQEIVKAASESRSKPIVELCRETHSRWRHPPTVRNSLKRAPSQGWQLRLMAQHELPLLENCRRSTASGIALHSLSAARNNGMAPLALPEINDLRIPPANRTAMLECLVSGSWKWSGGSLFPDAKRLLDEQDPNEVWVACAGLLNRSLIENDLEGRSSCRYWVEALQRRLELSEEARQQQSKAVWSRLTFEVYLLLKNDPASLPELGRRFASMLVTSKETPAEAHIIPILEMIKQAQTIPGTT